MTASRLNTGVKPTLETSCKSITRHTVENVLHNTCRLTVSGPLYKLLGIVAVNGLLIMQMCTWISHYM